MSVSVAIPTPCSSIGEGPHWDPKTKCLLYVDINEGDVHSWDVCTHQDTKVHVVSGGTVGFVIPRKAGGYVVGPNKTISVLDWDSQTLTPLAELDASIKTRFNDAKCDAAGRLWTGTYGYWIKPNVADPKVGSMYSLDTNRSLHKHLDGITISNGLAWTGDNSTMFYIDSTPQHVYAFDYDINKGSISNQRVAIDFGKWPKDELGVPDGMCMDTEDKLWIACFSASKVVRMDPVTGQLLQTVNFPCTTITSCCFGGDNMDDLYVTSSRAYLSEETIKKQPLAGSVFKVTGLGVKGTPAPEYEG